MIWAVPDTTGLTPLRPWTCWEIASASEAFSEVALPAPVRAPPDDELPGMMVKRLVPRPCSWLLTEALAPWPSATMAMTAATPMMMPSVVSTLRPLLACSAASAEGIVCKTRMLLRPAAGGSANMAKGSVSIVVGAAAIGRVAVVMLLAPRRATRLPKRYADCDGQTTPHRL